MSGPVYRGVAAVLGAAVCGLAAAAGAQDKAPVSTQASATAPGPAKPLSSDTSLKSSLTAATFSRDPYMSPPLVSPDGKHLAWVEGSQLVVYDLQAETDKRLSVGDVTFAGIEWINNDYLVAYLEAPGIAQLRYLKLFDYSPLIISNEAKFVRPLFARDGKKMTGYDLRPVIRFVDAPEPYAITLDGNRTGLVDVATGKRKSGTRLLDGDAHFFDRSGAEMASVEFKDSKISYGATAMTWRYRTTGDGKAETLRLPKRDNVYYVNFDYSEFEKALYWTEFDYAIGAAAIYKYDTVSAEKTLYKTGPTKDMQIAFDSQGRIVGLTTVTDRVHTEWTDPYRLKITTAVQEIFPSATVEIVDQSEDGKQIVLMVSAPEAPDSYYVYSAVTKELVQIGVNYPALEDQTLAEMTYVTYKARDGLDIPAYITRRKDTPPNAPLIVMPHGGPAIRDVYGFDYEAQFLASRGYVVLQPEYRGSGGFGDAFERAGNKHMLEMTTDLEDGVRYLQGKGMIDPKKVCIVGWSWGGYLVQAGLSLTPDTYACGVSGAGVSDLIEALQEERNKYWGGYSIEYWRGIIGRKGKDTDLIRAASPIEHIAAIKAPLLLIHGDFDPIVSIRQSENMNAAMTKAGKTVTYMPVKFMWHGPATPAERLLVLNAEADFIAKAFARIDAKPAQ